MKRLLILLVPLALCACDTWEFTTPDQFKFEEPTSVLTETVPDE